MNADAGSQPMSPYQIFDGLSDEASAALRMDIIKNGIRVPIEIDEKGAILDGHNRAKIAAELGIDCPRVTRTLATEEEKIEYAVKANLLMRHVGPVQWARAFLRLMELRGIERHAHHNRNTPTPATFAALAAEVGVKERTARDRLQLLEELELHPELMRKVDAGELTATAARREKTLRESPAKQPPQAATPEEGKDQPDRDKQVESGAKMIAEDPAKEPPQEGTPANAATATPGAADRASQDGPDRDSHPPSSDEGTDQPDLNEQGQSGADDCITASKKSPRKPQMISFPCWNTSKD